MSLAATERPTFVEARDVARLLREELRKVFPSTRMNVRTSATGTLRVRWTDGPTKREVEEVALKYAGADFDPTTDSSHALEHLLDGKPVRLLTQYVFCDRRISYDFARSRWDRIVSEAGTGGVELVLTSDDGEAVVAPARLTQDGAWDAVHRVVRRLAAESGEAPDFSLVLRSRLEVTGRR